MTEQLAPAVLADDLRALAEIVPFERHTCEMLEMAADRLDEFDAMLTARKAAIMTAESPAGLLRRAAAAIDTAAAYAAEKDWTYVALAEDGEEWGALLSPQVATPLAAWLRGHADYIAAVQVSADPNAAALARALLGEDQP